MATVPNLPKPFVPSASSDTVVDLCSTCFVCNQCIREATTEEDGEQALWCEGLHQQWAHARCVNVSEELYQALQDSLMLWTCASCTQEALRAYHYLPGLQQTLVSLQATVAREVAQLKETTMASNTTSLHLSPDKSVAVVSVSSPTGNPNSSTRSRMV